MSAVAVSPWAARRERAGELRARHRFADELLALYLALLPVQEDAWRRARDDPPGPGELPRWAAAGIVPAVVEATVAAGPAVLAEAAAGRPAEPALDGWLAGAELDPVDRYLARASLGPVLEALGAEAGAVCARARDAGQSRLCPCCGGQPQLSWLAAPEASLASGPRSLLCARCATSWSCSRSICPSCGESREARLSVFTEQFDGPVSAKRDGEGGEPPVFPHLRIAGCSTCSRYLIEVDLGRDARAVPEVDELTALPLDLYAAEQGLAKLTPNLMGF